MEEQLWFTMREAAKILDILPITLHSRVMQNNPFVILEENKDVRYQHLANGKSKNRKTFLSRSGIEKIREYSKKSQGEKTIMNRKYADISKEELADLRKNTGLSQRLFGEKIGTTSAAALFYYEKGVSRVTIRLQKPIYRLAVQYPQCLLYPKALAALAPQDEFSRQALEIIHREALSLNTLKVWKSRGAIPKKYLQEKPQEPRISLLDLDEDVISIGISKATQEFGAAFTTLVERRKFKGGMPVGYYLLCLRGLRGEAKKKKQAELAATQQSHTPPHPAHQNMEVSTP